MFNRTAVAALFLVVGFAAQDVSAYYHTPMGRFLSRDPNGQMHASGIALAVEGESEWKMRGSFTDRGGFVYDPHLQYQDGPNLYQYVGSRPVISTDPTGLFLGVVKYGNYCGFSTRGPGQPIDSLDRACQAHDKCLATWKEACNPFMVLGCNGPLCTAANRAYNWGGCAREWPNSPAKQAKCKQQAWRIMIFSCYGDPAHPPNPVTMH